jgi:putative phosphonate catabolism associated alcohol dehydrogenase
MNDFPVTTERLGSSNAGVFLGAGQPLDLRTFPLPSPDSGEAIVRIECCTLCGSDLHTITGKRTENCPSILGHEILGVVDTVGDPAPCDLEGRQLRAGDRITWSTSVSCGDCDRCRGGMPQKCRTLAKYGHELAEGRYALSGGLSEFLLLRRGSTAICIPRDIPAEVVCPVNCATATIASAFRAAGSVQGRRVLILGAGMLGLTAAAFSKSQGAATTIICDVNVRRLERAKLFGADYAVQWDPDRETFRRRLLELTTLDQFDVILELSGSVEAVECAFNHGDIGARIVLVGSVMKSRQASLDPERIVRRWYSIHGVHNYAPNDLRTAVTFLEQFGSFYPFANLVEFTYPLTEINAAIDKAVHARPFRVAICP